MTSGKSHRQCARLPHSREQENPICPGSSPAWSPQNRPTGPRPQRHLDRKGRGPVASHAEPDAENVNTQRVSMHRLLI